MIVYSRDASPPEALLPFVAMPPVPSRSGGVPEYTDRHVDGSWFPMVDGKLSAIDQLTDRVRWTSVLYPPGANTSLGVIVRGGDVLLVTATLYIATGMQTELSALEWSTGRILWRTHDADGPMEIVTAGSRVHAAYRSSVRTLDAKTGRELWRAPILPLTDRNLELPQLAATTSALVVVQPSQGVRVFDPVSGAVMRAIATSEIGTNGPPLFDRDVVYTSVSHPSTHGHGVHGVAVVAVDVSTGAILWQSRDVLDVRQGASPIIPLALDVDTVYACFGDDALRAYDRATGALTFSLALQNGCALAMLDPDARGARSIVVARHDGLALLERAPTPWIAEHARIVGHATAASGAPWSVAPVLVGGDVATTDASGDFDITVEGRGVMRVLAQDGNLSGQVNVAFDGRATPYRADVKMHPPPPVD